MLGLVVAVALAAAPTSSPFFGVLGPPQPGPINKLPVSQQLALIDRDAKGLPLDDRPTHNWDEVLEETEGLRAAYFEIYKSKPVLLSAKEGRWFRQNDADLVVQVCNNAYAYDWLQRKYPKLNARACSSSLIKLAHKIDVSPIN